jgi:hypothetical protein
MRAMFHLRFLLAGLALLLTACAVPPASPAAQIKTEIPAATVDLLYQSNGGGEPRGTGYWLAWNTCVEGNQSAMAKANGGRAAGWTLLDDLLADPGILMGLEQVKTCEQAAAILQDQPAAGEDETHSAFYRLAAELLTAQLNLAVPAETCPAVEQAVQAGQLLLISAGYGGNESPLAPKDPVQDGQLADFLTDQLTEYNAGQLCR